MSEFHARTLACWKPFGHKTVPAEAQGSVETTFTCVQRRSHKSCHLLLHIATVIYIVSKLVLVNYLYETATEKKIKGKDTRVGRDKSTEILLLLIDGIGA